MPRCDHARRSYPIAVGHVSLTATLVWARHALVPLWDIPSAASAHVPFVELFVRIGHIACASLPICPSCGGSIVLGGRTPKCCAALSIISTSPAAAAISTSLLPPSLSSSSIPSLPSPLLGWLSISPTVRCGWLGVDGWWWACGLGWLIQRERWRRELLGLIH